MVWALSGKHVRQDEGDHPAYNVETQEYFRQSVGPIAHRTFSGLLIFLSSMHARHEDQFPDRCRRQTFPR